MRYIKLLVLILPVLLISVPELASQPFQINNSDFEKWDTNSISLPVGWNSYCNANCNLNIPYAATVCKIITGTKVHEKTAGSCSGGSGRSYLTLRTQNVNGGGLTMAVSGLMSNGLFNIGSISVYTPQNYFSTERSKSNFCQPLNATPDSLYIWVKYYAYDDDSSRARIVAYLHGDTNFQYMNHISNKSLYTAYINHLISRTDTVSPAINWTELKLPFIYDGNAIPKYLLIYLSSDSCILGGHIGNCLSVDDIRLIYSSWLSGISVDSADIKEFRKDSFNYVFTYPAGTSPQYIPQVRVTGEVDDIYDSILFIPSAKGLDGGKSVITVTAEDHISTHTYTVTYEIAKSDNAALSSISCDTAKIRNFHPDTLTYNVVLPAGTHIPPIVTATTEWAGLSPQIAQASSLPGDAKIVVTAEDGITRRTYTVHFSVALSNDATASWIRYNSQPVPGFHKDSLHYTIVLPYGTTSVQLTAAATWSTAVVQYRQISSFPATASVTVIAEDRQTKRTYWVDFSIAPNSDASLDSLFYFLANVRHTIPNFSKKTYQYSVLLPEKIYTHPSVKAIPSDSNATVRISYAKNWDDSTYIWIKAENGTDSLCYSLFFQLNLSKERRLSSITVGDRPLADFKDTVYQYNVTLDSAYMPKIKAELKDTDASLKIIMPNQIPGSACLTVTAEDTNYKQSYWIHFSLPHTNSADLLALGYRLGNEYVQIDQFHKDTLNYRVLLPELTTTVPVLECVRADFYATDTIIQARSANDSAFIQVTSENRDKVKAYKVFFEVAVSKNADLSALYCNGELIQGFHKDSLLYHLTLHYDSTNAPHVKALAASPAASLSIRQAVSSEDTAWVSVTAQDTSVVKTYKLVFHRMLSPVTELLEFGYSLENSDSSLILQDGVHTYNVTLKEKTEAVPYGFRFVMQDSRSKLTFLKIPASVNDTLSVRVVSERGVDTAIYLFAFSRQLSSDVLLDTVWIDEWVMSGFSTQNSYEYAIPSRTSDIPAITAKPSWKLSETYIMSPVTIFGSFQIRVIAEDKIHYKVYTIQLRPQRQEARLKAIFLNERELLPYFNPDTLNYIQNWALDRELDISARTMDPAAIYNVKTIQSDSGPGYSREKYEILVWAEDRDDSLSYFLEIDRNTSVPDIFSDPVKSYPNPANENWFLELSGMQLPLRLNVYATDGRVVIKKTISDNKSCISVKDLPNGIYIYKLSNNQRIIYQGKLIRQ